MGAYAFAVIQCTNPVNVGITGIVVQETLHLFRIITKEDKLKRKFACRSFIIGEVDSFLPLLYRYTESKHSFQTASERLSSLVHVVWSPANSTSSR